ITGDPVMWLLPDDASMEAIENTRIRLGLDKPIHEQFSIFVKGVLQGDFGTSFLHRRSVTSLFLERIPQTVKLMSWALGLGIVLGIPLGIIAALNRNSALDRFLMTSSFLAYSIPNFVLGIFFILIFSLTLRWLPSGGYGNWRYMIMPVVTYGASHAGLVARLMRSSMLDVIRRDFIRTADSKGLPRHTVIMKHAFRIAVLPVITLIGLRLPHLISGSFVIETIYAWPGAGRLIIQAAKNRDFPVLQYAVFVTAILVIVANLLVDLAYGLLDPRIKYD
ncbi:MAG TPA: ABC transporter permease, partial [Limnochordia bacterium]|nr:ABC transporter permease [Limnochordia bacterium]